MQPRIFHGSSVQQEKLLQALMRGLRDIADVEPWTTVFDPGVSTLERGRFVGMLSKADVALEAKEGKVGETVEQISQPTTRHCKTGR